MSRTDDIFKPALSHIRLPILTLDNKWHRLFTQTNETKEIKELEKKLNDLLKIQGKVNTEKKQLKAVKRKLMDEILQLTNSSNGEERSDDVQKTMDRNKQMVEECNQRLAALEEENESVPDEIKETNYQLMIKTMELCYKRLEENQKEIEYFEKWIQDVRVELKQNIIRKQDRELSTYELYSYMHNIFGKDVINIFDMHYNPEKYRPKTKKEGYIE